MSPAKVAVHQLIPQLLKDVIQDTIKVEGGSSSATDFNIYIGSQRFAVEVKERWGVDVLGKSSAVDRKRRKLLVVPFMSESGARQARQVGLSWMDYAGNSDIEAPGLRIIVRGNKNRFPKPRKDSLFSAKASRLIRTLLMDTAKNYSQTELVRITHLNQGYLSGLLRKLQQRGYVSCEHRRYEVRFPGRLLAAWHEKYDFEKHQIVAGHFPARSGEQLSGQLSQLLTSQGIEHAATGLAGAWLYSHYATFRLATFYVTTAPDWDSMSRAGFRRDDAGANCWIVLPNDSGVFEGSTVRESIPCVHPLQIYLDLKEQPERSSEAATQLCEEFLPWAQR